MQTSRCHRFVAGAMIASLGNVQVGCVSGETPRGASQPQPSALESQSQSAQAQRFDGETLFKGIFFRSGPVAQRMPEIGEVPHLPQLKSQAGRDAISRQLAQLATHVREVGIPNGAGRIDALAKLLSTPGASADQVAGRLEHVANTVRDDGLSFSAALAVNRIIDAIKRDDASFFDRFGQAVQSGRELLIQSALNGAAARFKQAAATLPPVPAPPAVARVMFEEEATDSDVSAASDVDTSDATDTDTSDASSFESAQAEDFSASEAQSDSASQSDSNDTSSATDFEFSSSADNSSSQDFQYLRSEENSLSRNFDIEESFSFSEDNASASSDIYINQGQIANYVQLSNAVQVNIALQVSLAAQFVVAVVVYLAFAVVVPEPGANDPSDTLRRDMMVNALASDVSAPASASDLARMFPGDQFR
jgi:hypothetical protein